MYRVISQSDRSLLGKDRGGTYNIHAPISKEMATKLFPGYAMCHVPCALHEGEQLVGFLPPDPVSPSCY